MIMKQMTNMLHRVRQDSPLIHQITNYVSVNDCANITLAIGASPVMAQDANEVAEMVSHAKALVLNIGTLNAQTVEAMILAGKRAKSLKIPVVFDPVGVGATMYRTEVAKRILAEVKPDVIRCNMSELKILCGLDTEVKGVDSVAQSDGGEAAAMALAKQIDGVVAVTGQIDIIACKDKHCHIHNGHTFLTRVTGTGCMTTALVASYCAVGDPFVGAVSGVLSMGIAGELAVESLLENEGIGTFKVRLMDAIFNLNDDSIKRYARITE
ncbi:MAG: Hydroxyethylthiazole kinase [Firmicutes bacterium]|nr:Hydroxyethylthiazole kinase [Bacillota bacterium]